MNGLTSFIVIVVLLLNTSVVWSATANEDDRSSNSNNGLQSLISGFIHSLRGTRPENTITPAKPNGAGCADCEGLSVFDPITNLINQLRLVVTALTRSINPLIASLNLVVRSLQPIN